MTFFMLLLLLVMAGEAPPPPGPPDFGMGAAPTVKCGGQKGIERWRLERTNRIAAWFRARVMTWASAMGDQIKCDLELDRQQRVERMLAGYRRCVKNRAPRGELLCVAGALALPEICSYHEDPEQVVVCRLMTLTRRAVWTGRVELCDLLDPPDLTSICRSLTGQPLSCGPGQDLCRQYQAVSVEDCRAGNGPDPQFCAARLWLEAAATNDPSWCRGIASPDKREACLAVLAGDPAACPAPAGERTVLLTRGCRLEGLATVLPPGAVTDPVAPHWSVPFFNPFKEAAICRATTERATKYGPRRVLSPEFMLDGESLIRPRTWQLPSYHRPGSAVTIPDCLWALPEHGIEAWGSDHGRDIPL